MPPYDFSSTYRNMKVEHYEQPYIPRTPEKAR